MKLRAAVAVALCTLGLGAATFSVAAPEGTLIHAAENKRHDEALKLLAAGADARARDVDGTTALHWAAHYGNAELVDRLIRAGAEVNVTNDYGSSPMMEAATIGDTEVLRLLLKAGADVESANREGQTALMAVARTGNVEAARLLIEAGADVNAREQWGGQTALMWATAQLQPEMVAFLIRHGADVDARGAVRDWQRRITAEGRPKDLNNGGFTPLLYAARGGCLDCARHLVEAGADINLPDPDGVTPLILAIINFHFDVADYLIEAGADIQRWDLFGRTPLYAAVDMNTIASPDRPGVPSYAARDLIRKLLEAGANPNAQLKQRRPPFRNAILERGADNTLTTGATALLRAAHASDNETVELLLAHGALVDLPNAAGLTPLMAAAGLGLSPRSNRGRFKTEQMGLESVRLLLAAGADINARINERRRLEREPPRDLGGAVRYNSVHMPANGQTALHGAARHGWNDMVELLVANGARIDVADENGRTPYDMAMGRYEPEPLDPPHSPHLETAALLERLCEESPDCTGLTQR
jgi:ankyrin repeat protein